MRHLVLGGARSGKPRFAMTTAESASPAPVLIVTAEAHDEEMHSRIERHRKDRGEQWRVLEAPTGLAAKLLPQLESGDVVVIDCLTLWLSNALARDTWPRERRAFIDAVAAFSSAPTQLLMVSNEVGNGVVPLGKLSRTFVDELG